MEIFLKTRKKLWIKFKSSFFLQNRLAVVRQSSDSRQAVTHQTVVWQSSSSRLGSHQIIKSVKFIIHCAAFETKSLFSLESK
jgi:hypothetical protein